MPINRIVIFMSSFWLFSCDQLPAIDWASSSNLPTIPFQFSKGPVAIDQNYCKTETQLNIHDSDWKKAKNINIFSRNTGIHPKKILMDYGKPYILKLYNSTSVTWDFKVEEFFKNAAISRIIYEGKNETIPCIKSIRIGKLKWAEVHLIPLIKGKFSIIQKKEFSLEGFIFSQPPPPISQLIVR